MPPAPSASTSRNSNKPYYNHDVDSSVEVEITGDNTANSSAGDITMPKSNTTSGSTKVKDLNINNTSQASYNNNNYTGGPVDLDALFGEDDEYLMDEDGSLLQDDDDDSDSAAGFNENDKLWEESASPKFFNNPNKRLLDNDASLIPGSPFSKPANQPSNRPSEPLAIAKYSSTLSLAITLGWVGYLLFSAIDNYSSPGRIVVEVILSLISFFGLFWNSYFIVSSLLKCFIPAKAFLTNTKYCSIIPLNPPPNTDYLDVTIQIPVYKESLKEVLMPTLKSCMKARDHYTRTNPTGAKCNIVCCDDGMMALLRDNFAAAEMLWDSIEATNGRIIKLSQLLKRVPRASRHHLKGLRSKNVYEVFHRMIFYYHFQIGFVARSTVDRRGKFKKASNLNSHLRLALGASQLIVDDPENHPRYLDALITESHNDDGSRYIMFGNDVSIGQLICINDADARMSPSVIFKTVPEFLNDKSLGFTQHATKTMNEQRGESYFTNLLTVYTDALYQGHFLLSSILGCHPPLVGHSIFLRTEAVKQCGRMRTLRKAQRWLKNIGLPFLPVDQVGFSNLRAENRIEYWSESHVSEDFELMIHLYNLGFNGRYVAYPDCEFQEGITRTFDEEAGRHRKFSLGAHELVFNSFQDILGHGLFTPLFRTFLSCDIPSYYKIFLTAYLCSYTSGGAYIIVFSASAIARILDSEDSIVSLYTFSPAGVIILNVVIYYLVGYITFIISIIRMHYVNNKLLFPEYRKKWFGACCLVFVKLRYCLVFQFLFYSVATFTFYFLGSMDHLLGRPGIVGATNKDSINISRCTAFWDMAKFNSGSWSIALVLGGLAYATILQDENWEVTSIPETDYIIKHALFAGPAIFLMLMAIFVPIFLNPYILGWPFLRQSKPKKPKNKKLSRKRSVKKDFLGREIVDFNTFMKNATELQDEIERVEGKPDVELGSLCTKDLRSSHGSPVSSSKQGVLKMSLKEVEQLGGGGKHQQQQHRQGQQGQSRSNNRMYSIAEALDTEQPSSSPARLSSSHHSRPSSYHRGTSRPGSHKFPI